jgi:tetratricopeptide (TPR) repeat protein
VILALVLLASLLPAQTLQQAEALWKTRRYQDANAMFRELVAREPRNPEIRVRWGRMFLEHWQADEADRLFTEALELNPADAGALLGKALVAAEFYAGSAAEFAQRALRSDPKLVEAQELLARLALEDDNKAKAEAEAKRALALDSNSVQAKAILATLDWLADKKESPWDPHAAKGYETAGHFFMLNRRYEESVAFYRKAIDADPQLDSARSQLGVNLMRLGRDEEAFEQFKTCWDNGFQDSATKNSLTLMDSEKNFVTFRTDRSRDAARHRGVRETVPLETHPAGAGGSLSRSRGFRRAHARHAGPGSAGRDLRQRDCHGQSIRACAGQLSLGERDVA